MDLKSRLAALEARAAGARQPPPNIAQAHSRRRLYAPFAIAPGLALALAATALAGGAVVGLLGVIGLPGAENPGQALAGAHLECMSPPEAAAYLSSHDFTNVVWQVETGSEYENTDYTELRATPPDHGYVVPGAFNHGRLIVIVDQRIGAMGTGACTDGPMP